MSENKRYYYLKLKENFFDSEAMILLESMQDGMLYSNVLLKMYLKSLKNNGILMLNDVIPYNSQMIATITRHQVGTVEKALDIFKQLGLIDVLDGGAIYMSDIQLFIGKSSTEGDRKRAARIELKNKGLLDGGQMSDKRPPEIEKEIEKEIEIKSRKRINYQRIVDMYNDTCVSFPKITKLSDSRKKSIKARLKIYSIDDFKRLFELAEKSTFLKGGNGRNWSATFDWLIKDANMAKVLDGNYQDKNEKEQPINSEFANIDFEKWTKENLEKCEPANDDDYF